MTTSVQIINWGCMAVKVEQVSQDNRTVFQTDIVKPFSIGAKQFYVHQGQRLVVTEMESPK